MIYKIIVDKQPSTTPSDEKKEYIVNIEELRCKGGVHDSLIINKDEAHVVRRLSLSEYQVLYVLENEIIEPLTDVNITLFEGDNYIYLMDMIGNKFYAEYIVKNDFTNIYATRNEMNTTITETASTIELSVNQKLTGYATTQEMNATITAKANEINLEVDKKVNNEDLTGANIALRINNDTSEVKINADKIQLSANDVLNLLAGNTINLKSKNIAISSDNFNVDQNGNLTCSNAQITDGNIVLKNEKSTGVKFKVTTNDESIYTEVRPSGIRTVMNEIVIFWANGTNTAIRNADGKGVLLAGNTIYVQDDSGSYNYPITLEGSNGKITCNSLVQTSLLSEKKNFEKFNNALEIIKDIDIYKYNLKSEDDETKKHLGFVIGDNYKYSKEVTSDKNDGVDVYSFVSLCCQAIKEQQIEIKNLKQRLEALENG